MPNKKSDNSMQYRTIPVARNKIDEEARTVEIAFSSEEPVERFYGWEILDHSPASVDLGRLNNGGAVLWGHDSDNLVGVVEKASIDSDRRGRAVVRFADTADAEPYWQKVVQGIIRNVSVGYWIDERVMEKEDDNGPVYRATRWTPAEVSFVSIPADSSVGVGRNHSHEEIIMSKEKQAPETKVEEPAKPELGTDTGNRGANPGEIAREVVAGLRADREQREKAEKERCEAIRDLGKEYARENLAIQAIEGGKSIEDFRTMLLEASKAPAPSATKADVRIEDSYHRSGKLKAFSNTREGEEAAFRAGKWAQAVIFGDERAMRWCKDYGVRVMTGTGVGDNSVVPDEMVQPIIDLREQYGVARQECYVHPMSSDTATVPRRKTGVTAYFPARSDATTESDATFDDISLVARELSALTRLSNSYMEDTAIDLGDHLATEMAYAFAVKEDQCLFNGDGTSTYGGINGIRNKILGLAGAVDGASGIDTFAEVTNTDLMNVQGALPEYPGIVAKWYVSKRGSSVMFGRLAAAAGGNRKMDMADGMPKSWDGDPIVISQAMPSSTGDLSNVAMAVYGDLNLGVTFGDRRGFMIQVLRERYAEYRQTGIIGTERFDINVHGVGDSSNAGPIVALIGE